MRRDSSEVQYLKWSSIRQVIEFALIVFVLNYMTVRMESVSDDIINGDFINPQTNMREVFHSMNAIHLVQKAIVYCLCTLILKGTQYLQKSQENTQEDQYSQQNIHSTNRLNNQNHKKHYLTKNINNHLNNNDILPLQLTTSEEIFLGIATFLSIRVFASFQSVFNVIYLIIAKYSNFLFIIPAIHFAILYWNKKNDEKLCTKNNFAKMLKDLVLAVPVGVGAILVKLLMTEIPSFFRSYSGKSPQQPISLLDILIAVLALAMDYVLYIGLFYIKQQYAKRVVANQQQAIIHDETEIRRQLGSIVLLRSWTKYTVLMLCCYCMMTGELFYLVGFIWRHSSILLKLIEISLYYFVSQCITCRMFLKYRAHVFISVIMSNGMFGKAYYYLFKSFTLLSVPYYLVLISMFLMIRQYIVEQNECNRKNTYCQQTFSQDNKIKEYDSVDMDQKNIDYQQQRIDLVVGRNQV